MGSLAVLLAVVVLASAATMVLVSFAVAGPRRLDAPAASGPEPMGPRQGQGNGPAVVGRTRLRLVSRLVFVFRQSDSIALDCTLVEAQGAIPDVLSPPVGLPFTLQLRAPDTSWFAARVEELLQEWSDADEPLVLDLDLVEATGHIKATLTSGESSVHLELAGAAGLGRDLRT